MQTKHDLKLVPWMGLVVLLLCMLGGNGLQAQTPLSLDQAIATALQASLKLEIQRNNVAAREIQDNFGVAGGLPTVTATASDQGSVTNIYQKLANGNEFQRNNALGNNLAANVTGTMVLYNGLRIQATKDRLEQLALQSEGVLASQIMDLVAAVMTQYYDVRRQEAYLKTITGSLAVAEKNMEFVTARQLAGLANDADIFQARLDLNALRQQLLQQELTISQAKVDLLDLMDGDMRADIVLTDSIVVDAALNFDSLLAGTQQNPQVEAAGRQIQIQQLMAQEVIAQRMPTLRANAGYNFGNNSSAGGFTLVNRNFGPFANLSLSVPIYSGSNLKRQEQVAILDTRNAQLELENLTQTQETALWKSWRTYQNALLLLETERENAVLSRKLLDLMVQKYTLRQSTILELKQAQKSFEEAGYRLVNLEFAAKAAEIELLRLGGMLQ
jgi:outer membrane protein